MINKDTMVKVVNKYDGTVGYDVPDLQVHRNFYPGEHKDISFDELEKLSFSPGGLNILTNYLEIADKEVAFTILGKEPEPEYHYTRDDVTKLMTVGTLDQFLDCLDFAPESIKEVIKDLAVELPLNDVEKRQAIKEKLGFDVDSAIKIKNTKYDGGAEEEKTQGYGKIEGRRAAPVNSGASTAPTGRRYQPTAKD